VNLLLLREEIASIIAEEMPNAASDDTADLPVVIQSPRARAIRRIAEISNSRGWQIEITRALDRHAASYVDDLPDNVVIALRDRMEYLEECVQCACDPDDAPPAR
jgi:hypothetical protein